MSSNDNGINVANQTEAFSPTNCVPLSPGLNFWNLCLFFAANVFAHAATIHPRTGATKTNSFRRMLLMIVAPITAGTVATHAIVTFILGVKKGGLKWAHFLNSKESLSDAVPAGAVGILIPRGLAPVVAGRWKLVGDERLSLMLNHERSHPPKTSREPHIPAMDASLEFILPPQSRLPGYENYKFYPSSSSASELIAVVQLIYGIYQLVTDYGSEIRLMGLSSPYTCAIPYLLMSLVNLVANILMPSYTHVVILPPQHSLSQTSSTTTLASKERVNVDTTEISKEELATVADIESRRKENFVRHSTWSIGKRYVTKTIEWDDRYMSLTEIMRRGTKPENDGYTKKERKKLIWQNNPQIGFMTWSFDGSWWGKGSGIRRSSSWSRDVNPSKEMETQLEVWLEQHYPGVETSIHARPLRVYQWSRYISVFITLIVTTGILGVLTRFQIMVAADAGRFISWIYIPPTILLVPFFVLGLNRTSARFIASIDAFSSYNMFFNRGLIAGL